MKVQKRSIKRRVLIAFVGFTLLLSVLHSGFSLLVAYVTEDEVLTRMLAVEADYLKTQYRKTGDIPATRVGYVTVYLSADQLPPFLAEHLPFKGFDTEIFTQGKGHYHLQKLSLDNQTQLILVADVSEFLSVRNLSGEIVFVLCFILVVAIGAAVFSAYRIAEATTRPIVALARSVTETDVMMEKPRHAVSEPLDEIGVLARTIDEAVYDLKQALKRENDFTRDLSHELRTPIAIIKNMLMLAETRDLSGSDLKNLRQASRDLDYTVQILLALARNESLSHQSIHLRSFLEDYLLKLHQNGELDDFSVDINITHRYQVVANPQLLALLVKNLIDNARVHASAPRLSIRHEENRLSFGNVSEPIPALDVTQAGTKREQSQGLGQGLYLVKRIAERLGWEMRVKKDSQYFSICFEINECDDAKYSAL